MFKKKFYSEPPTGLTTPRIHARRGPAILTTTAGGTNTTASLTQKTLSWKPWKRKPIAKNLAAEKMLIPLPIPHPVHIAIAIHNRDSEQPIPLDSEICWDILKAIEECNGDIQAANMVARYRGGGNNGAITGAESSIDSLDDDDDEEDDDEESSSTNHSQTSYGTRDSLAAAGGTETLPCGGNIDNNSVNQRAVSTTVNDNNQQSKSFQWTLSNWGAAQAARRRNNSGTVRVDLASPEDISLDTDNSSRVVFSAYGTTV